jgi:carbonic anhydrase/acetyltransferase-like protein (isoleucine patch superfamily)
MGATVMDGCMLERRAMLGAGSLLPPGKVVKAGQLWVGRPARYVRDLTSQEIEANLQAVVHYAKLAEEYRRASRA